MADARPVDLRSDTVTRPSAAMRQAMVEADVGDDVYGEDPTVAALEAHIAALFGHEAALFAPTGSMANQIALQLVAPPATEVLCDADAHVVTYEMAAAAAYAGISTRTWSAVGAEIDVDRIDRPRGMDITLVTTATNDEEGRELLSLLGFPFAGRTVVQTTR